MCKGKDGSEWYQVQSQGCVGVCSQVSTLSKVTQDYLDRLPKYYSFKVPQAPSQGQGSWWGWNENQVGHILKVHGGWDGYSYARLHQGEGFWILICLKFEIF